MKIIIEKIKRCKTCKYYESYRDAYFGDAYEPDDEGFCRGNKEMDYHTHEDNNECEYYKP